MKYLFCVIFLFLNFAALVKGQILYGGKRVVFRKESSVYITVPNEVISERFTTTLKDIDSADEIVKKHLLAINKKGEGFKLDNYYKQYVGLIVNGKKWVYMNASTKKEDYFLVNTLYPKGGGKDYFTSFIDIDSRKIISFYFNAPK